jgi:hypothetical protein
VSRPSIFDIDPVEFGKAVAPLVREIVRPLKDRISELEIEKNIDAEVINELALCIERVDAIEASGQTKSLSTEGEVTSCGVRGALIDRDGALVLTMTDGSVQNLGRVVGRDGLSLESRELEYVPETHEIVEHWTANGKTREFRYPAGGIHDRGYWRQGSEYGAGDAVTHNGSLWIALRATTAKPCIENREDWRIGARKGRDAK